MTSIKPSRVVVDGQTGYAVGPSIAKNLADLDLAQFVFVRHDGWSLAACGKFAIAAFNSYRGDWVAVFETMPGARSAAGDYHVADAMDPGGFEERIGHYLAHAQIAVQPAAVGIGDQVIEREPCDWCGWRPEVEPSNVPAALLDAASCQCLPCRTADGWHAEIATVHAALEASVAKGHHAEAGRLDAIERVMVDRAAACLADCEGRATT
jgi:hypothetical protein